MIFEHRGRIYKKSDEIYEVVKDSELWVNYVKINGKNLFPIGTKCRLINGVDGHEEIGWHPEARYFTVCREGIEFEHLGVDKGCLRKGKSMWDLNLSEVLDAVLNNVSRPCFANH